ncbi:MAG: hypothetical protein PVI79_00695 [Gammaproteobacteria bacterium]|jgi:hypothetical protein
MSKLFRLTRFVCLLLMSAAMLGGCATIVGDKTQLIPISSDPDLASIVIVDEKGSQVFRGTTPTTVTLAKSDGSYWGKKSYAVTITKPGYSSQTIPITASANGWYIGGNIIFGGIIGWFIVDPFNGAMYTLTPKQIESDLGRQASRADGSISIVLIEDVPPGLRAQMRRLD